MEPAMHARTHTQPHIQDARCECTRGAHNNHCKNDGIQRDPQRRNRSNAPAAMATPHRAATVTIANKTRVMVAIGYQREGETRTRATSCTMVVEAMLLTHARNPARAIN